MANVKLPVFKNIILVISSLNYDGVSIAMLVHQGSIQTQIAKERASEDDMKRAQLVMLSGLRPGHSGVVEARNRSKTPIEFKGGQFGETFP